MGKKARDMSSARVEILLELQAFLADAAAEGPPPEESEVKRDFKPPDAWTKVGRPGAWTFEKIARRN